MLRRLYVVAAIIVGGVLSAVVLSIATGACRQHLYARWLAEVEHGPPVRLSMACAPSHLAHEYALHFAWYVAAPVAAVTATVALLLFVSRFVLGSTRTLRVRNIVGWANVGALTLVMIASVGVAGCGEGEWQFFALPSLAGGFCFSVIPSFLGVGATSPPSSDPDSA